MRIKHIIKCAWKYDKKKFNLALLSRKEGFTHVIFTSNYLINQNLKEKIKELTENLENIHFSFEEGMDNFGRLSEMLTTLKKNKSRAENSILQLAYSEKIVSKGDDILYNNIKITTLKVAEEWAYIEYENEYFTSITKFIKEKENITYPPVPEQRDLFAIGNRSYQDIRRILGSKEGVNNKMFQNKTDILPYLKETENTHIFETPLFIEIRSVRNYDNRKYSCQLDIVPYLCLIKIT
ncbi:uncharacterized protein OCT59_000874 [Rhizophagus irregularis]|uniref:uncharacterized protein n=1 Tax=Rhizophagus irregularis TaxID=588596 RepID=UPI00331D90F2|nr:hypothetical protein OCT59_000874 [Rhizophagus irregularis]